MKKIISQEELEVRLRRLRTAVPEESRFRDEVMRRVDAEATSPSPAPEKGYRLWRLVMKGAMGMAACLVMGVAAWHFSIGEPRIAYGIEGLPERLMEVKSLHLKGTFYLPSHGGEGTRVELFLQRPGRLRVNGLPTWEDEGSKGRLLETNDLVVTPTERLEINPERKKVIVSTETEIDARLRTEQMMQQNLQLMVGFGNQFVKLRREKVGAVEADVYENRFDLPGQKSRVDVFIDPSTGLPLKSEIYGAVGNSPESLQAEFDTIETNGPIPKGTFAFNVPPDYEVVDSGADVGTEMQLNDVKFGVRFAIQLDRRSMLVCWRMYDVKSPETDLTAPLASSRYEIQGNGGLKYHEKLLRADEAAEGYHWRWSVFAAERAADSWANAVSMRVTMHGGTCSDAFMPAVLPGNELADVIEKAQGLTLPKGEKAMTLKEIEAKAQSMEAGKESP